MQKKAVVTLLSIAFLASANAVYAVTDTVTTVKEKENRKPERMQQGMSPEQLEQEGKKQIQVIQQMDDNSEAFRGGMKQARDEYKAEMRIARDDFKQDMRVMKLDLKNNGGSMSADFEARMEARRNAFLQKLETLSDDRKASIAAKIDTKLSTINERRTDKMSQALSKLTEILNRLIDRTNTAKTAGQNTSAVETAINKAKASITAAEAAVAAQKAKTYTASFTNEDALGSSFGTVFTQLQTDLQTTYNAIKTAKTDVKQVASELRKLETSVSPTPSVSEAPTATPTP
jgi:hypothetical protein